VIQFSIILPVRNGGDYIKKSVASILSQSVPDFNLIILDSGSSDGTVEWVASLKDPRIIFYPSDKPLSIEENWGRIKYITRNEWMTIIGHDDLLSPDYLEIMKGLIEEYPDASLYAPHLDYIDADGNVIRTSKPMPAKQSGTDFLEKILQNKIGAVGLMMRSAHYDSVGGVPLYPGLMFADFPLWIEMTRISYKATAPESCMSYRVHKKSTTALAGDEKYNIAYELYIKYLASLKKIDSTFNRVINENAKHLIRLRCSEFSKRLLGIEKKDRKVFSTVASLVKRHKEYADLLIDNNSFDPSGDFKIRMAKILDSTAAGRFLYKLFRPLL
jgi:glycosyltransferase involved in cell wall biosynthesis